MTELALRVVFSLAVVVGLILLLARFAGRRYKTRTGAVVQVLHRQQLSRGSAITVVTVGGRVLVLGLTEHQVSVLTELDPTEIAEIEELDELSEYDDSPREPGAPGGGPLTGSVLSPQTWRQALAAVSGRRTA